MFNAMRRIISESAISESGADVGRTQQQQYQQQQQEYPQQQQQQQQSPDHHQRANLVEMESDDFMDVEGSPSDMMHDPNRPISHIRKASGQFSSTHSSLSGASDHDHNIDMEEKDGMMEHDSREAQGDLFQNHVNFANTSNNNNNASKEQLEEQSATAFNRLKLSFTATTLQRMDDEGSTGSGSLRASSQNSSRDWGWFEDVHHPSDSMHQQSSSSLDIIKKNSNETSKKGHGHNKAAAAANRKYATLVPLSDTVRDVVRHQETGTLLYVYGMIS